MQLKALINNRAKAAVVSPQLMPQNYMLERLIDRVSRSRWRDGIVVKGGMLLARLSAWTGEPPRTSTLWSPLLAYA